MSERQIVDNTDAGRFELRVGDDVQKHPDHLALVPADRRQEFALPPRA